MPRCAVFHCRPYVRIVANQSFHRFPWSKPETLLKWITAVQLADPRWKPGQRSVLCSDHFEPACFDRTGQTTRLRDGAVPTLVLESRVEATYAADHDHTSHDSMLGSALDEAVDIKQEPLADIDTASFYEEMSEYPLLIKCESASIEEDPLQVKEELPESLGDFETVFVAQEECGGLPDTPDEFDERLAETGNTSDDVTRDSDPLKPDANAFACIYPCAKCPMFFTSLLERQLHQCHQTPLPITVNQTRHEASTSDPLCLCNKCDLQCNSRSCLFQHMRSFHKNDITFKCNECDFSFLRLNDWILHKAKTHEERTNTIDCDLCTYKCISRNVLAVHKRKEHGVNSFEPCKASVFYFD